MSGADKKSSFLQIKRGDIMTEDLTRKEIIFNEATRLFAEKGYKDVTLREVGKAAGISEPGIYRHYEKKADILDEIIAAFGRKLRSYLLTKEKVDRLIESDTPRELLERCIGRFTKEDTLFMVRSYRIVCMEQFKYPKAMKIIKEQVHEETAKSIQYVLDKLIERGKIPAFNTWFFSMIWTQSMFSGALIWMSRYFNGSPMELSAAEYNEVAKRLVDMALTGQVPYD